MFGCDLTDVFEVVILEIKAQSIELNYLAIVDSEHFEEVDTPKYDDLIIIAVKIGSTRLIDNITLT